MKLASFFLLASSDIKVNAGSDADMAAWQPVIQTQVLGQYADAWEMMKEMPQFNEKLNSGDSFYIEFYEMNERGEYQAAFDKMMKWKIEHFGVDMVKKMGYDVTGYVHLVENPYHHAKPATYDSNGDKWQQFYESMDPSASGAELQEFWQKHAQMKKELGTNDSYHKEKHNSAHSNKNWEKWIPVQKLQQAGDYKGAWELMKNMPEMAEKAKEPAMAEFISLNESGEYETAFHGMMKYKIEQYGADAVRSWGYDISQYEEPSMYESNGEKWKKFYESMDPSASGSELQEFWQKHAQMKKELGTDDSYHKEKHSGAHGDHHEKKHDWSKWEPVKKLQSEGDYKGAWEMMKSMPEFEMMKQKPGMEHFVRMNEEGQHEKAYHTMMQWKVDKFGKDMVESWGYDVSKYEQKHHQPQGHHGRPGPPHGQPHGPPGHHGPHGGKPHWMEKKQMFYESGMADLVKPIMNKEVMEDIVDAVENMGGMDKLLGKLHMYSDPDFANLQKNMRVKKNEAFTVATLTSSVSLMETIVKDKSARATLDRLAKLDKQLPEATTCVSYTGMLSCSMEGHLAATPYTDQAMWPSDLLDAYLKLGMLTPTGTPTQSVLSMPNLSQYMSTEEQPVSVMATALGSVRMALTSGTSCIAPWVDEFDYNEIDIDYTDALEFHANNKPKPLTADQSQLLTVKSGAGEHQPSSRILVRTCKAAGRTIEKLRNATDVEEIKMLKLKLGGQTKCALIFNEPLPVWPSCNPLDNGQMYERLWIEKNKIKEQTNYVWGERVEMPLETLDALGRINEQLISTRYVRALSSLKIPCLYSSPKQCFMVTHDPTNAKVNAKPVEIMDWDVCVDKFGEDICKLNYFVAADSTDPINYIGAPLLCAEHGSVTMRAIQGPVFDGHYQFQAGDYNVGAIAANHLNGEMWKAMEELL